MTKDDKEDKDTIVDEKGKEEKDTNANEKVKKKQELRQR